MEIETFTNLRPFLYHLTDRGNLALILRSGKLISTKSIIELSGNPDYNYINEIRRTKTYRIYIEDDVYSIRDQKPISEKNLKKCLEDDWACADFYNHLNSRVFMWSKLDFLNNHFNTYADEAPVILRFDSSEILTKNPHVKFCRLNSGATRSSSHHNGAPPPRGIKTFLPASEYKLAASTVKEVTFEIECVLAGEVFISDKPYGEYKIINQ